ncbi:MAG: imidazole glycerol phosphate synthase cyclase subunit [Candidatus Daviesbacteria bacterium]|nr:imidazole glycerol phosphate synthase cyclase subunit [Candidatus Daviesbacteria bacterium]
MKTIRIISKLDIKGPNLVKGIHLEGLRVLGKPEYFAKFYYENGADELLYMDVVASLYNRNSLHDIISKTAEEIFIPLAVGGGIRTIEDIKSVLRSGADKVSLNTAAIKNPAIIKEAAEIFGSSTIAVTIEAAKQSDGSYLAYTDNGREHTGIEVLSWAKKVEKLGAGEIILTSIDKEGTGEGYDIELIKLVSRNVSIPVVASGGAGSPDDIYQVIQEGGADAVVIASMLHYDFIQRHKVSGNFTEEGNIEFLKGGAISSKITPSNILEIKKYLKEKGVEVRLN